MLLEGDIAARVFSDGRRAFVFPTMWGNAKIGLSPDAASVCIDDTW